MKIFIRADSSFQIGTGHIVRCLTLAQSLRDRGAVITFICRELDGNIISLVEEKQFKVIKLSPPKSPLTSSDIYEKNRGVTLGQEITELSEILKENRPNWMIVDHYSLPKEWEEVMSGFGSKIFSIDDLFRAHHCDALLDQNAFGETQKYSLLTHDSAELFVGPEFALLNPSFFNITPETRNFESVKSIIVFYGGSDITGETLKTIQLLSGLDKAIKVEVIIGKVNPALEEIKLFCKDKTERFNLHIQTSHMAELLNKADLFVGAGGTITWERCYFGLPAICISTAENQVEIAKKLADINVHRYLGHWNQITSELLLLSINAIVNDKSIREQYSNNSLALKVGSKTNEIYDYF